jgi:glycosyltransferase involved in cell wall biosynthesis
MSSTNPRVTFGFPVYNDERYLPLAFEALRAQDFTDFEVVVCDNGSSDGTWAICERYAAMDPRWRIHRNETNLGIAGNVHRITSLARGELFRFAAHDDILAPTALRRCVEALDANPGAVLSYTETVVIDGEGNETLHWHGDLDLTSPSAIKRLTSLAGRWRLGNEIFGLMRTDALRACRPRGAYLSSDICVIVEMAARGAFVRVPAPLFYRRIHSAATFGGERSADEVASWHAPGAKGSKRAPRPGGDYNRLAVGTAKGLLLGRDLPWLVRGPGMLAFEAVWAFRRTRVTLGRWRRRLTRTPMPALPWEKPAS